MGLLGVVYVVGRVIGKFGGARLGAWLLGLDATVQRYLGFTLLAQAGLAVGITLAVERRFPDHGPVVSTIVLAAVVIYEMVGPICTRVAIVRSGEAHPPTAERDALWATDHNPS